MVDRPDRSLGEKVADGLAGFLVGAGLGTTAGSISLLGYKPQLRTCDRTCFGSWKCNMEFGSPNMEYVWLKMVLSSKNIAESNKGRTQ